MSNKIITLLFLFFYVLPLNFLHGNNFKIISSNKELRQIVNINNDWYYLEKNINDIKNILNKKHNWTSIKIPHTWNQWDATDNIPGYRRDISWYKKSLFIPTNEKFKQYILYFEGVNITTTLYINGHLVGQHIGGYVGFEFNITDYITIGKENIIYVKVDNSINHEIIPSQKSDFFIYGGIIRDVWLKKLPAINICNIQILTPKVDSSGANISIKLNLFNKTTNSNNLTIITKIISPDNKVCLTAEKDFTSTKGNSIVTLNIPEIKNPELWAPYSPSLYSAKIILQKGKTILDSSSQIFGLRWFEFKEHGAFYLNGKRLLLRGTHRHEEYAGYGAAMPNELHKKDIDMIKGMGTNFVRLAHYPQDPEVYKQCDKLGLLVWDELPWCRGGIGNDKWKKNTKRLLNEQINQNINHPSIIIWSLGNEIYWEPDFNNGDNRDSINVFLTKLNNLAHQLDSTRLTAIRKYYEGADIIDVFSPSIWAGWYSGIYTNYFNSLIDARKKYKRFLHAEYGGASHVGRHEEISISASNIVSTTGWEEKNNQVQLKNIARTSDWNENYIVNLFDWHLHVSEQLNWFTGNAQWVFKDFGTPLRPENPIPYVNQKGLVDRAGKPKDAYYVFKSYWNTTDKFCYIESHTWKERRAKKNEKLNVSVFSNCKVVELFLNGISLGRKTKSIKKFPACGLNWDVFFNEGNNLLSATGFSNGEKVAVDSVLVNFSTKQNGIPDKIELSVKNLSNGNKLIEATVVDKNGIRCLDYNKRIYFSMNGNGKLLINYGTPTRSQIIEAANGKASIEFKPESNGKAVIEVRNQDFKGSYITIK
jgi:beta-galactosidase